MGLDMYLAVTADGPAEDLIDATKEAGLLQYWVGGDVKSLDEDDKQLVIAYWRKANAIHGWFVRTQADGVDECQEIPVSREALMDLVERCKKVLAVGATCVDAAEAADLSTQGGFFFGDTTYGEWYRRDLEETVTQIEAVLSAKWPMPVSFIYEASW